jgi:bis(5'-nucleosyl)-tetraphosphatase (symmetrical)
MAIYAIGDVQGCFEPLQQLLRAIRFNPTQDTLWFTGDLVNRGPQSLETLRFVRDLGDRAITVLGNHDLHLLAVAYAGQATRPGDTLSEILNAPDREALLHWLRFRPLMHLDATHNCALIHAGLPPTWDLATAQRCARDIEIVLRNNVTYQAFLENMYGNEPDAWDNRLLGWPRLRFATNCLTRLRFCTPEGRINLKAKMSPREQHDSLVPWFQHPARQTRDTRIVCGHWSTLDYYNHDNTTVLDSGCVWGGKLTAQQIDAPHATPPIQIPCTAACALEGE